MIADTSFLIDIMRKNDSAIQKEEALESEGVPLSITAVSVFELYIGFGLSTKQVLERKKIELVLENLLVFPLNLEAAKEAGEIYADKRRRGSAIDPEDAMIAGICKVNHEAILTRNVNHFSGIDGLSVESY